MNLRQARKVKFPFIGWYAVLQQGKIHKGKFSRLGQNYENCWVFFDRMTSSSHRIACVFATEEEARAYVVKDLERKLSYFKER